MVARRNLNVAGGEWFNDIVASLAESAAQSKTRAAGVIGLSADGDITWEWPGADGLPVEKSVKRFQVDLDDTSERADALAATLADAEARISEGAAALADLEDVRLPALADALENVGSVQTQGPPPVNPVVGKTLWVSPSGRVFKAVPCPKEETP